MVLKTSGVFETVNALFLVMNFLPLTTFLSSSREGLKSEVQKRYIPKKHTTHSDAFDIVLGCVKLLFNRVLLIFALLSMAYWSSF